MDDGYIDTLDFELPSFVVYVLITHVPIRLLASLSPEYRVEMICRKVSDDKSAIQPMKLSEVSGCLFVCARAVCFT